MTTIDREDLRAKAEAAPAADWQATYHHSPQGGADLHYVTGPDRRFAIAVGSGSQRQMSAEVAEHIAAFDPPTALALLDALDAAEAERDEALARIEKVRAEHGEHIIGEGTDAPIHTGECDWCGCSTSYPCWTRRALDGEGE